jgi:hypothetical protein
MYFWRIERLTAELRRGPLEQRGALLYVLAWLVLWTVLTLSPAWAASESQHAGDWASFFVSLLFLVGGTLTAYRANRGSRGQDFAARYFAIGWVLGIRLMVLLLLPLVVVLFVIAGVVAVRTNAPELSDAAASWVGAGLTLVFEAIYYWRLTHHFHLVTEEVVSPNGAR